MTLRALALAALLTGAACGDEGDERVTTQPSTTTTTTSAPTASTTTPSSAVSPTTGLLRFDPAQLVHDRPCDEVVAVATTDVDPAALAPGDGTCFDLGEGLDGATAVESARAELLAGGWVVSLVLTSDGIDDFNAVASECFQSTPACPAGQLAIVVDGTVVSAPSIQVPEFERDQIQISGTFDEAEATSLAVALQPAQP